MFGCRLGEIEQLLANHIVEGRLDAVSEPYGLGGFALFEPDFVPGNGGAKLVHGSGGIVSLRAEQNSAT